MRYIICICLTWLLFDESVATLQRLAEDSPLDLSILHFELTILREIGHLPTFDACAYCGEPLGTVARYGYQVSQGVLICQTCFGTDVPRCVVTPGALAIVQALTCGSAATVRNLVPSVSQMRELRLLVNLSIAQILGHKPKTLRYLPL